VDGTRRRVHGAPALRRAVQPAPSPGQWSGALLGASDRAGWTGLERVSGLFCKYATPFRLSSNRSSPLAFLLVGRVHGRPLKSTGVDPSRGTLVALPSGGSDRPIDPGAGAVAATAARRTAPRWLCRGRSRRFSARGSSCSTCLGRPRRGKWPPQRRLADRGDSGAARARRERPRAPDDGGILPSKSDEIRCRDANPIRDERNCEVPLLGRRFTSDQRKHRGTRRLERHGATRRNGG
jgi:hypothetical protein